MRKLDSEIEVHHEDLSAAYIGNDVVAKGLAVEIKGQLGMVRHEVDDEWIEQNIGGPIPSGMPVATTITVGGHELRLRRGSKVIISKSAGMLS